MVEEVGVAAADGLGVITLKRPKKLNALTLKMVQTMDETVAKWHSQGSGIHLVLVKGEGERAFCAGGDVRQCRSVGLGLEAWHDGQLGSDPGRFIREEYALDFKLSAAPAHIPQVSFWQGIVMGGGAGISVHGRFRVACETTLFAMPECAIGLIPDVGSSHFLGRVEQRAEGMGVYMAVTGARLNAYDCLFTGLATHFCSSAKLPVLESHLAQLCGSKGSAGTNKWVEQIDQALSSDAWLGGEGDSRAAAAAAAALRVKVPGCEIATLAPLIARCFGRVARSRGRGGVFGIVDALMEVAQEQQYNEWACKMLTLMLHRHKQSPLSQVLSVHTVSAAASIGLPVAECLRMEHRIMHRLMTGRDSDFYEGVRAVLVDKDRKPHWRHVLGWCELQASVQKLLGLELEVEGGADAVADADADADADAHAGGRCDRIAAQTYLSALNAEEELNLLI